MVSPAFKIGSLGTALGLSAFFANSGATQAAVQSVSTRQQINDARGITKQKELRKYNAIATPEKTATGFELLYYPMDIKKFYMAIEFVKYERPTPIQLADLPPTSTICLPIPGNLRDDFSLNFYEYDAGVTGSLYQILEGPENRGDTLSPVLRTILDQARQTQIGGSEIASQIAQIAAQKLRVSFNPLKSIVFDSPNLKSYNFSWTFAPHSKPESDMLRRIIKKIKTSVLPTYAQTNNPGPNNGYVEYNVFNYPNMAKIRLYPWALKPDQTDAEMFQSRYGFIDSFSINYSPENNIAFFNDSTGDHPPAFIEFGFSFREIEIHTATDYTGKPGDPIVGMDKPPSNEWGVPGPPGSFIQ